MFSLRIVNVDHYMSPPKPGFDLTYSQFRGSTIKFVPVIRIFGATPSGDKSCLHVHGVFPYVLVPYSGVQDAGSVMYQLASSLDKAINVSLGSSYSNKQYVFKITQVSGRPFYGYHGQDHQFLKIFFYTPLIVKRACDLLQNGAVCGTRFQIHEGHVPFILQFFIDYNLYGMSFIDVKKVVFRKDTNQPGVPVGTFSKDSVCKLEADAVAIDILNRIQVEGEMAVNPGLAAIWEEEKKRLNKDKLDDSSYRPTPPLAMSEVLLKEKLLENLKLPGKCNALLKENIPYPAETQRSDSNDMFDASMLDTHAISSLVPSQGAKDENTQIDEEIIYNLTQNMPISSGEVSLLAALEDLATHNEVSQNVEDDSILGSQAVVESVSDDDDLMDYSLALPHQYLQDSSGDSDSSFEDNIPQLDGVGDIVKKEKKRLKPSSLKDKENTSKEHNNLNESDTTDDMKSNQTSMIESENQEIFDEVFQDIEPFCSPLHDINNLEETERFSLSDLSLFEETEPDFNEVLKGDPSFSCKDSTFSQEVFFDQKIEFANFNPTLNTTRCSSAQTTPMKEYMSKMPELEKSSVLSDSNEDLLGISTLDQLFDDDLSEEMETPNENTSGFATKPEQDSDEQLSTKEKVKKNTDVSKISGKEVSTNLKRRSPRLKNTTKASTRTSFKPANVTTDVLGEENVQVQTEPSRTETPVKEDLGTDTTMGNMTTTLQKPEPDNLKQACESSPSKSQQLVIKSANLTSVCKRRKKKTVGKYDGWDMTNAEIETYFSQLNELALELSKRAASKETKPVSWPLIRPAPVLVRNQMKNRRKRFSKPVITHNSGCKFSKKEMAKLTACCVLLKTFSESELNSILKPKENIEQINQQLGNSTKKPLASDANNSSLKISKERGKVPRPLEQTTPSCTGPNLSAVVNKSNGILSTSLAINKPKKLRNSGVHDQSVIKHCQVVLNWEENNVPNTANDNNVENKNLTLPKKSTNISLSNQTPNKKVQAPVAFQSKQLQPLLNDNGTVSNVSSEKEMQISSRKLNEDLKRITRNCQKKNNVNNTKDVSRRELKLCKEFQKRGRRKGGLKNVISTEVNDLFTTKKDVKTLTLPAIKPFQIVLNKYDLESKLDQKENLNKIVSVVSNKILPECSNLSPLKCADKLKNSSVNPNGKWKTQNLKPLRKRNASLSMDLNQTLRENPTELLRRKSLNVMSLDGTCDHSSSSDENLPEPSTEVKCTPNKRRKSSSNITNTPKSKYVPLQVEIKKSPTVKLERISLKSEHKSDFKDVLKLPTTSDSTQTQHCSAVQTLEEKPLEPYVRIEKLSQGTDPLNAWKLPAGSYLKMKTKAYPLVKKLKISVKRWSTDEQGNRGNDSPRAKHMTYRRSSLPVTAKENEITRGNLGETKIKELKADRSPSRVEVKSMEVDKDNKVRKMLVFSEQNLGSEEVEEEELDNYSSPSSVDERYGIVNRRISNDMFEINSESAVNSFDSFLSHERMASFDKLKPTEMKNSSQEDHSACTSNPTDHDQSHDFRKLSVSSTFNQVCEFKADQYKLENATKFTPFLNPPTRARVESTLRGLGLPEVVNEEPFYSDPTDVTKGCEVGHSTVKLTSRSLAHLEQFRGAFYSVKDVISDDRYKSSKTTNRRVLTPLKSPPSALQAKEWLRSKVEIKTKKDFEEPKTANKIVTIPLSQGDMSGEDSNELSLTVSQCSPFSGKGFSDTSNHSTPKGGSSSSRSPLMASTPIITSVAAKIAKKRHSKLSLSFAKTLPTIQEEPLDDGKQANLQCDSNTFQNASMKLSGTKIKRILSEERSPASVSCQIDIATPENSGNYKMELENLQDVKLNHELMSSQSNLEKVLKAFHLDSNMRLRLHAHILIEATFVPSVGIHRVAYQYLTILTMELHVHTRGDLRPNPDHDAICCIFYNITNDHPDNTTAHITAAICVAEDVSEKMPQMHCKVKSVCNEQALVEAFIAVVKECDPDIFVGYEIELLSWGYLLQRASVLNINLKTELSRVKSHLKPDDEFRDIKDDDSELQLPGRIVLNLWRFLRHEVALQSYTFENIAYHVLHQRLPLFSFHTLNTWWSHRTKLYRWQVFEHYLTRVEGTVQIMKQIDLVGRTSEFARLFGIQFFDVLSRGSQFRVESMMLRLVKPLNYVAVSPSVQQRAAMRAPQSLPLIMEPQSRFYSDPVIVLDFQSLYPSIIIAYNYCYSTCLGRVEHLGRSELFEFGCTQLRVPTKELVRLKEELNFSPCGVAYVKQSVRRGVLPRMLEEILNTRLMVKQSMKANKEDKTLQRVLHNRQLGLKLIANVTYGYTGANFSGRMPCIEVGDSVVSKARETLERAIDLVSRTAEWGARVIYGDTDSMFVLIPGRSRQEAFRIGAEIAAAVTNSNPQPVKLKLEKVYQPCILQTKKRYVGYMYESPDQEQPVYDAKGIETVRRDGCPAVAKILEKSLRLLFESRDVSLVKRFVTRQFGKVLSGRVSVQELTFAREYRGAAGYRPTACVPALELAKQWRAVDPRAEPRVGQRVPYVIVAGPPGLPLIRLVRSPASLLHDTGLKVNAEYYISRVIIPPLDRCFSLIGANVASWYAEYPRKQHLYLPGVVGEGGKKATISQYFATVSCVVCECVTTSGVCDTCQQEPQRVAITLASQLWQWEQKLHLVTKVCQSCCGRRGEVECVSLDCPVLYRRSQASRDMTQADFLRSLYHQYTQPALT